METAGQAQETIGGAAPGPPGGAARRRRSTPRVRAVSLTRWRLGRSWLVVPPLLYVLALLVGPIVLIGMYSFNMLSEFPGAPTAFSTANWHQFLYGTTNHLLIGDNNAFWQTFKHSMLITLTVSVTTVLAGYPLAYYLAFVARRRRYVLLMAMLMPFFTSYLLRVIAWQVMLSNNGVINSALWELHLEPRGHAISWLIYSNFSVGLVLFYSWVPFVALPMFVVLENLDTRVVEAAYDLGAGRMSAFVRVILPLSLPGVIAGFVFVLIPTTGEFITPLLVGGTNSYMFGNAIQDFFTSTLDWNYGAVLALWLVGVVVVMMAVFGRFLTTDLRRAEG
jgi:spermidine/putrescine transport system permease protein